MHKRVNRRKRAARKRKGQKMKPLLIEGEIVERAERRYKRFRAVRLVLGGLFLLAAIVGFWAVVWRP